MYQAFAVIGVTVAVIVACVCTAWGMLLVRPVIDGDDDKTVLWDMIWAVNDVAREHPALRGTVIATLPVDEGIYAYAVEGMIVFNDLYTSGDDTIQKMFDDDVRKEFHPGPGRCSGPQFLGYHESAHLIDHAGGRQARRALLDRFGLGYDMHDELSGYSFDYFGTFAPGEALAEAYASVRCNGGNAVERELNQMLLNAAA